jgi:hypothetical protein
MIIGLISSATALVYAVYTIIKTIISGIDVPGYASLLVVSLTLSGIILICLGFIGEYLGRIYNEVKGRPIYVVKKLHKPRDDA